jgi:DNA-binding transcriptional LysR family regulator
MNVFVRVAHNGSFVGGARDLSISRAMTTKHIMDLEKKLGVRLFNRTTRQLSLTEIGSAYLDRCQQVLSDINEMEASVSHMHTEPQGTLRLSAPTFFGTSYITPALSEFIELHPKLDIDLILQSNPSNLIDSGIDIAIFLGALENSNFIARKLASYDLVVCGSPRYFKKRGVPQEPHDLKEHNCLINLAMPPYEQWKFHQGQSKISIKASGNFQANIADPIRIASIQGAGIVMLPNYMVNDDIKKGRLQAILTHYSLPPLEVNAVYPHRKYLSAKVSDFLIFLQEWLTSPGA